MIAQVNCDTMSLQLPAAAIVAEGSQPPMGIDAGSYSIPVGLYEHTHDFYWSVDIAGVRVAEGTANCSAPAPAPAAVPQVASPAPPDPAPAPPEYRPRLLRWGAQ